MGEIIHKIEKGKETKKEEVNIGFKIVFFALNFLLVPFSAYATFKGYSEFLGIPLAVVLALATALMFFGLNYAIMTQRSDGKPHTKQSIGFLLPLMISFFGNFPYFYGNQMQGTLLNEDLAIYMSTLSNTYNTAINDFESKRLDQRQEIETKNELAALRTKLDAELGALEVQIRDGGCFERCDTKWNEIKQLFVDYNIKHFGSPGTPLTDIYTKIYSNFETAAHNHFQALKEHQDEEIRKINEQIDLAIKQLNDTDYSNLIKLADTLLLVENEQRLKVEGGNLLKRIKATNDELGQKASTLPGYKYSQLLAYEEVNAKNIKGVLESAFIKNDNNSATTFSVILSLVIDLAVLGFVFLILSYKKSKKNIKNTGPNIQTLN